MKLITRRECLALTKAGWIVMLSGLFAGGGFVFFAIHPFLAITQPVRGEFLVVEGWVDDSCLTNAIEELKAHPYKHIITTGIQMESGFHLSDVKSYAEWGARRLKRLGIAENRVVAVPAAPVSKDRTYASATALQKWLEEFHPEARTLDVVTETCHARRTRLLFKRALGDDFQVGIIAGDNAFYDEDRWWLYSEGVKTLIGETVAYVYAKLLFRPRETGEAGDR